MPRRLADLIRELTGVDEATLGGAPFWDRLLGWPPDVFALTSTLLSESGAYRLCVSPPACAWAICQYRGSWNEEITREARAWREGIDEARARPAGLPAACDDLRRALDLPVRALGRNQDVESSAIARRACLAVFRLHALADEASAGFGVPETDADDESLRAELRAGRRLVAAGTLSTFDTDRVRVLPKLRTPGAGLTLRSLSHHLSSQRSEIDVSWDLHPGEGNGLLARGERRFNLLLLPWPFAIEASHFVPAEPTWRERPGDHLAFRFAPPVRVREVQEALRGAIAACRAKGADVHGVVLPEAAVVAPEVAAIRAVLEEAGIDFLLAGVRGPRRNEAHLALRIGGQWKILVQPKHHRWCLDGEQIHQYHLGSALHPSRRYWEDIEVPERQLRFVGLASWLALCHLICEDLARLDPVSEVIRSVGPNLVIALLLDGPQLEARWPGRYASVLADDPGSSVLTLTSLGMVKRCLPRGRAPSRVVALWKDARRGVQELALDPSARALLCSICGFRQRAYTADGRAGPGSDGQLVLSGVEQIGW